MPTITHVANYERDVPATFEVSRSYVRYQRPSLEANETAVEYNVDEEDEGWLAENSLLGTKKSMKKKGRKSGNQTEELTTLTEESATGGDTSDEDARSVEKKSTLSLRMFEHMIDLMEKATGLETIITLVQAERLIVANIPHFLQLFGSAHTGPAHNQEQKKSKNVVNVKTVITEVHNYWVNKRSKLRKPLLRKYWPVTASNDTNPHMVFRPREKERYNTRKKRVNDPDAYKKMKQLRIDFTKIRALLDLIKKREELNKVMLDMQCDWFEQRLYEMIDTSALPRESDRLSHDEIEEALNVPKLFDTQGIDKGKKKKRKRSTGTNLKGSMNSPVNVGGSTNTNTDIGDLKTTNPTNKSRQVIADQSNPPSFLHPLKTRQTYATSWEDAVPFITSYVDSNATQTTRFRHRPRIGRGGRVIIDRLPQPGNSKDPPANVYTTGGGATMETSNSKPVGRMLDLLPAPLDVDAVRRRIEQISAAALEEDDERITKVRAPTLPSSNNGIPTDDGNDTEAVLVKMSDWTETDEQIFGQEVGPTFGPI